MVQACKVLALRNCDIRGIKYGSITVVRFLKCNFNWEAFDVHYMYFFQYCLAGLCHGTSDFFCRVRFDAERERSTFFRAFFQHSNLEGPSYRKCKWSKSQMWLFQCCKNHPYFVYVLQDLQSYISTPSFTLNSDYIFSKWLHVPKSIVYLWEDEMIYHFLMLLKNRILLFICNLKSNF